MKTFLRILIIGAILLILVFLSIGIVKIVPKALSSLASASVSISSLFGGKSATSTTSVNATTTTANQGGFIIATTTTETNSTSTGRSLTNILFPNANDAPVNNYVPPSGTDISKYNNGTGAYTSTRSPQACVAGGSPDIAVTVLSRGIISGSNGQYVETSSFTTADTASIKFKVENRGTCPTGNWNFRADLPSSVSVDQVRTVANVASLPAGSAVTGVANFDSPRAGSATATFTVTDSSGRDINISNNTASVGFSVVNGGGSNGGSVGTIGDGRPDLLVRIIRTGTLDYSNNFIATNGTSFRTGDRVAVQFEVVNQGANPTGAWNFQATLTGNGQPKLYNNTQYESSIPGGAKSVYTIAFDSVFSGNNVMSIGVDSTGQVNEFNEGNNTSTFSFYAY